MRYYIASCICIVWPLVSSILYTDFQCRFPEIAKRHQRDDLGMAVFVGMIIAILGPIGLFAAWCLTGFTKYGIWRGYKVDGE